MQNDAGEPDADAPAAEPAALQRGPEEPGEEAFAALLLRALVAMAVRSKRQQADLTAALRGAGLAAEPGRVRAALRLLQGQGCIEHLVPLSDGGLLLSVTPAAFERLGSRLHWLPLGDAG